MQSSNGSIDTPIPADTDRQSIINHAKQMFNCRDSIEYRHDDDWSEKIDECQKHLPVLYFSRSVEKAYQCYTNAGTLHQYFASSNEFEKLLSFIDKTKCIDPLVSQDSQSSTTNSCGEGDAISNSQPCKKKLYESMHKDTEDIAEHKKKVLQEEINNLFKKLEWISVEQLPNVSHGSQISYASLYETTKETTQSSMPSFQKPHNKFSNKSFILARDHVLSNEYLDYRPLALKVDLYEDLRQANFSQPSGVEYAWATQKPPVRNIVSLNNVDQWHYDAIFVEEIVLSHAIENGWKFNVGESKDNVWSLKDPEVKIIRLTYCRGPTDLGLLIWILSNLTYPLAWVIDQFEMMQIGNKDRRTEAFVRTASLVDIHEPGSKLIFVIDGYFKILGTTYETHRCGMKIQVHNFDATIENIVKHCLKSPHSLREAFSEYTEWYFRDGVNWPEINSLTTTLIVRWHQRIECYKKDKETPALALGAPASVLKAMGLTPDDKITDESYSAYGGMMSVNSIDQRFIDRTLARKNPAIKLGSWGNLASLTAVKDYIVFNTHNIVDPKESLARCRASCHDCLCRARFLRKGFEQSKRATGCDDEISISRVVNGAQLNWITATNVKFAKYFINEHVAWSWDMNQVPVTSAKTLTGIRTVSSWWRSQENTQWTPVTIQGSNKPNLNMYLYDDTSAWTKGSFAQFGRGEDDPKMEKILMRLDVNASDRDWGLTYKTHLPFVEESPYMSWIIDSSYGAVLAAEIGWVKDGIVHPDKDLWGWGIAVWLKDGNKQTSKTIVIPLETADIATANHFSKGTILFTDQPYCMMHRVSQLYFYKDVQWDSTKQ